MVRWNRNRTFAVRWYQGSIGASAAQHSAVPFTKDGEQPLAAFAHSLATMSIRRAESANARLLSKPPDFGLLERAPAAVAGNEKQRIFRNHDASDCMIERGTRSTTVVASHA